MAKYTYASGNSDAIEVARGSYSIDIKAATVVDTSVEQSPDGLTEWSPILGAELDGPQKVTSIGRFGVDLEGGFVRLVGGTDVSFNINKIA